MCGVATPARNASVQGIRSDAYIRDMSTASDLPARCPECGLPADRHTELIPVERRVVAYEDQVLVIHGLISEKCYELPERQELLCPNGHAFPIPGDLDLRYA